MDSVLLIVAMVLLYLVQDQFFEALQQVCTADSYSLTLHLHLRAHMSDFEMTGYLMKRSLPASAALLPASYAAMLIMNLVVGLTGGDETGKFWTAWSKVTCSF